MKTEDLIVQLASSASPVRRLASPVRRFASWTIAATAIAALGLLIVGPRADIRAALQSPAFLILAIVTFLIWVCIIFLGRLIAYDHVWGSWSPSERQ